jgi:hypothetical protein
MQSMGSMGSTMTTAENTLGHSEKPQWLFGPCSPCIRAALHTHFATELEGLEER